MQELQGHSLGNLSVKQFRQESTATSKTDRSKRKLGLPWHRSSTKQKSFSTDEGAIIEEGRSPTTPIDDLKKDVHIHATPSSSTNSSSGSTKYPPNASTASDAIDKLYRLDDDDLEAPEQDPTRRGYDG